MRIFPPTRCKPASDRGFTLVELLVVLALLALAGSAVMLMAPGREGAVRHEADRLAMALAGLRDEAVVSGSAGIAQIGRDSARLSLSRGAGGKTLRWPKGMTATPAIVRFDATGLASGAQHIRLSDGDAMAELHVAADGSVRRSE